MRERRNALPASRKTLQVDSQVGFRSRHRKEVKQYLVRSQPVVEREHACRTLQNILYDNSVRQIPLCKNNNVAHGLSSIVHRDTSSVSTVPCFALSCSSPWWWWKVAQCDCCITHSLLFRIIIVNVPLWLAVKIWLAYNGARRMTILVSGYLASHWAVMMRMCQIVAIIQFPASAISIKYVMISIVSMLHILSSVHCISLLTW